MSIGECGNDCSICVQSCLNCDGNFKEWIKKKSNNINVHTFKPYFDVTMGKVVNSKHEINEYCKQHNMVYAGDKELTQQCNQNRYENAVRSDVRFIDGLTQKLNGVLN